MDVHKGFHKDGSALSVGLCLLDLWQAVVVRDHALVNSRQDYQKDELAYAKKALIIFVLLTFVQDFFVCQIEILIFILVVWLLLILFNTNLR